MRSSKLLSAVVAVIPLVGACGAAATPPPPTPTTVPATQHPPATEAPEATFAVVDACALLDERAAEKIAGTPLETGVPGNPVDPSCMYNGPVTGPLAQVSIFVGPGAKKTYDIDMSLKHEFVALPNVGDEAYIENNAVFFRVGETWVAIELVRLNDPKENEKALIDAATAVATALAAR